MIRKAVLVAGVVALAAALAIEDTKRSITRAIKEAWSPS